MQINAASDHHCHVGKTCDVTTWGRDMQNRNGRGNPKIGYFPVPSSRRRGRNSEIKANGLDAQPVAASDEAAPENGGAADRAALARHELSEVRHDAEAIRRLFENGKYPYTTKLKRAVYEKQKAALQVELLKVQKWVKARGERIVVLFEGRDAAGKGGTIKRFMEHLNPRGARVVALDKPTPHEQGQWYFQRYVELLPTSGEIVLFDRSWYNRAGVERVMGFCKPSEYLESYN